MNILVPLREYSSPDLCGGDLMDQLKRPRHVSTPGSGWFDGYGFGIQDNAEDHWYFARYIDDLAIGRAEADCTGRG